MNNPYQTKSHDPITLKDGTELPLMDIKGKPYLQVAHRLVWFRKDHPTWTITTEIKDLYIIECENPREKVAVRETIARLEIPAVELADREAVFTKLVLYNFLYRQCPQGNQISLCDPSIVVFESPKGIVYSRDQTWMAAIAIGIVRHEKTSGLN